MSGSDQRPEPAADPEGRASQGSAPEGGAPEGGSPRPDAAPTEAVSAEEVPAPQASGSEAPKDEALRDEAPEGEVPEGEAPEDEASGASELEAGGGGRRDGGLAAAWSELVVLAVARWMRPTRLVVALLLVLLGFSVAVQVRSVSTDPTLAALGQEDLVRILANLDAHEERLREEIEELEESKRRLSSADQSQQEALADAQRRADELGILAGTLPAEGPGLVVSLWGDQAAVSGARLLDAVQELRGAGAEAMQIQGADGPAVRVVASTYFGDADGGVVVDGVTMHSPYTLTVIGDPQTLAPALNLPGGVVESVQREGGTVTVHEEPGGVEVSAVRAPIILQHAKTVS